VPPANPVSRISFRRFPVRVCRQLQQFEITFLLKRLSRRSRGETNLSRLLFNDVWHAKDKLTASFGLRYELQGPWSERFNRLSYFDPRAKSYLNQVVAPGTPAVQGDVSWCPPGNEQSSPAEKTILAPRIGVAYSLTPKTVVRSGYGIILGPSDFLSRSTQ